MSVSPKNHPNIPSHGDLPSPKIRSRAFIICGLEILILTVTVIGFFAMYESSPEHYRNKKISSNKELNKTIFRNWSSEVNSSAERSKRGEAGSFTDLKMRHGFYVRSIAISTAAFAIGFFVVGLSIHGILKDKAKFMVPHMIAQVISAIALVAVIILYTLAIGSNAIRIERESLGIIDNLRFPTAIIACSSLGLIFLIFAFITMFAYYRHLKTGATKSL